VDLQDPVVIKAMATNVANYIVIKEFEKIMREMVIEEKNPEVINRGRLLSSTAPFRFPSLCSRLKRQYSIMRPVTMNWNSVSPNFSRS